MSAWIIAEFVPDYDGGHIEYAGKVFRVSGSHDGELARLTADLRAVAEALRRCAIHTCGIDMEPCLACAALARPGVRAVLETPFGSALEDSGG